MKTIRSIVWGKDNYYATIKPKPPYNPLNPYPSGNFNCKSILSEGKNQNFEGEKAGYVITFENSEKVKVYNYKEIYYTEEP